MPDGSCEMVFRLRNTLNHEMRGFRFCGVVVLIDDSNLECSSGPIDLTNRLFKELLETPEIKDSLIAILRSIDPQSSRELVRTLMWTDAGVFLSVVATLPIIVNAFGEAAAEFTEQLNAIPSLMTVSIAANVLKRFDGKILGEALGSAVDLMANTLSNSTDELNEEVSGFVRDFSAGFSKGIKGNSSNSGIEAFIQNITSSVREGQSSENSFVSEIGETLERNPEFVDTVLLPLVKPILKRVEADIAK